MIQSPHFLTGARRLGANQKKMADDVTFLLKSSFVQLERSKINDSQIIFKWILSKIRLSMIDAKQQQLKRSLI